MANCPPKTPPTGCLDVTIQESIILPNYNRSGILQYFYSMWN
jgi:hypothetical protein